MYRTPQQRQLTCQISYKLFFFIRRSGRFWQLFVIVYFNKAQLLHQPSDEAVIIFRVKTIEYVDSHGDAINISAVVVLKQYFSSSSP